MEVGTRRDVHIEDIYTDTTRKENYRIKENFRIKKTLKKKTLNKENFRKERQIYFRPIE